MRSASGADFSTAGFGADSSKRFRVVWRLTGMYNYHPKEIEQANLRAVKSLTLVIEHSLY
jgi:hypothetical protein